MSQINLQALEPVLQLRLMAFAQGQLEIGEFLPDSLRQFRQMIAQDGAGGAKTQLLRRAAAQIIGQRFQPIKKRLNEPEQLFAGAGQGEGSALEEGDS